jgi:cyclase
MILALAVHLWRFNNIVQATINQEPPQVGTIYQIAPKLYVVPEGGGNTAVFVTGTGVVLVDTKFSVNWKALLVQVRTVTDKPIICVINTHAHPDHIGGNIFLPENVDLIVEDHTAANIKKIGKILHLPELYQRSIRTYKDAMTLFSGEDAIDLYYFGPAHTNGDTFVVFRSAGVMHAGDVFPDKRPPIIDIGSGGNAAMYADTLDKAMAGIRGVQQVISGHGAVFTWNDFVEYSDFYKFLLQQVTAGIKTGEDRNLTFHRLRVPARFNAYKLNNIYESMDQIFWSIAPWHSRLAHLPAWLSRKLYLTFKLLQE